MRFLTQCRRRLAFMPLVIGLTTFVASLPVPVMPVLAHAEHGHPARIQDGTCDSLGRAAFPLTGVGAALTAEGTPAPTPEAMGADAALPVQTSETTLDTTLSSLVNEEHAVVVYESDEAMDHVIACGAIGGPLRAQMPGMVMPGDELAVGLAGSEESGFAGIALLRAAGKQVAVNVYLVDLGGHPAEATHDDHDEDHADAG
jgi:hypothetical protein